MMEINDIRQNLELKFGARKWQETSDRIPTFWASAGELHVILRYLKSEISHPYRMLYDLTAIDERQKTSRDEFDFTVVYHLLSLERNAFLRIKLGLAGEYPTAPTVTSIWSAADWYEREVWDMFGIKFEGHPNLRRILMPLDWKGHPLRKEHPARATEMEPYQLPEAKKLADLDRLEFRPEEWGMDPGTGEHDYLFLNVGPQHPGTHGVIRFALQLDGEQIINSVADIGFHHRGAEKMGERQSWHTYIPYTDRIDYLDGVLNNMPYVLSVEAMAGIKIPPRAEVIRIMLNEIYRISSHLVWYGTFAQDLGAMSPVFYLFNDREKLMPIIQAITGARMHSSWFRIGGVAADLPEGWDKLVRAFLDYMPARLKEYDDIVLKNKIFRKRTVGVGAYTLEEAIDWGITGPGLRACGLEWDFRKKMPYGGYDKFEFDVPTHHAGDVYGRSVVRVEEIRQSLRIVEQCLNNMPAGPYKSEHPLTTPPLKQHTMKDIETLIHHFVHVSWGPVIPTNEAMIGTEAAKGGNSYYLISDGNTVSYRTRIRTPSFPHIQAVPIFSRGAFIADFLAILGSVDYVLADLDR